MNILIVIPHFNLLSPQGHRQRLDGFVSLLSDHQLNFLLPSQTPEVDRNLPNHSKLFFFNEHTFFGRYVPYLSDFSSSFQRTLRHTIKNQKIDLIIFDFPWGLTTSSLLNSVPIVYFSIGVEYDFANVTLQHIGIKSSLFKLAYSSYIYFLEKFACMRSSLIITMSSRDSSRYQQLFGLSEKKFLALNQPITISQSAPDQAVLRKKYQLPLYKFIVIFHGSWLHLPNRQAIESIQNEIAPTIAQINPDILFILAGPGVPILQLNNLISFGFVDGIDDFINCADLAIVPIYEGAGVRMKIFDYMTARVPVLSTAKGIEGIDCTNYQQAIITADNPQAIIQAIIEISQNKDKLSKLANEAISYLEQFHDPKKLSEKLNTMLDLTVKKM